MAQGGDFPSPHYLQEKGYRLWGHGYPDQVPYITMWQYLVKTSLCSYVFPFIIYTTSTHWINPWYNIIFPSIIRYLFKKIYTEIQYFSVLVSFPIAVLKQAHKSNLGESSQFQVPNLLWGDFTAAGAWGSGHFTPVIKNKGTRTQACSMLRSSTAWGIMPDVWFSHLH